MEIKYYILIVKLHMRWMILVQIFYGRNIYSIHTKRSKNKEETNTSNVEW